MTNTTPEGTDEVVEATLVGDDAAEAVEVIEGDEVVVDEVLADAVPELIEPDLAPPAPAVDEPIIVPVADPAPVESPSAAASETYPEQAPIPVVAEQAPAVDADPFASNVVYVQAPVPPERAGNRGIGALLAVAGAVIYGAILLGVAWLLVFWVTGASTLAALESVQFWTPVIAFVVAFVLLVIVVNRASWWSYVLGSIVVGLIVLVATVGADLIIMNAFALTPVEFWDVAIANLANPFTIVAALLAREVALWWGALIARRGATVKARNQVAFEAYEAELASRRY